LIAVFTVADVARRLRDSLADIEFGVSLVPAEWTHVFPPPPADAWSVAMNLAHLVVYEEELGNPILSSLARGGDGTDAVRPNMPAWWEPDAKALSGEPLDALLSRLRAARSRHVDLVESFDDTSFNTAVCPVFGARWREGALHSPGWIASKTWQHTWEHGNAVLRVALFAPR
jgi:hypothetical protein